MARHRPCMLAEVLQKNSKWELREYINRHWSAKYSTNFIPEWIKTWLFIPPLCMRHVFHHAREHCYLFHDIELFKFPHFWLLKEICTMSIYCCFCKSVAQEVLNASMSNVTRPRLHDNLFGENTLVAYWLSIYMTTAFALSKNRMQKLVPECTDFKVPISVYM